MKLDARMNRESMRRRARNSIAELLLEALENPVDAEIDILHVVCEAFRSISNTDLALPAILRAAQLKTRRPSSSVLRGVIRLASPGGPLRVRHAVTGEGLPARLPPIDTPAEWWVGLAPEVRFDLEAVYQRVGAYRKLLGRLGPMRRAFSTKEPLRWGLAQAAACFNAGLFFEAHEILEGYWLGLPRSPLKQFVQGVIQICVGIHHAREGRVIGAVNQLGKGLEKTAGETGTLLGLECPGFLPQIQAIRDQLLSGGRSGMDCVLDIPRMRVTPDP